MKSPLKYEKILQELPDIQEREPYIEKQPFDIEEAVPVESTPEYWDMKAVEKHEMQRIESESEEKRRLERNALTQQLMREKKRNHEELLQNLRLNEEKPVLNMIKRNSSVQFKLPQSKNY
jgi:hypothetical protein